MDFSHNCRIYLLNLVVCGIGHTVSCAQTPSKGVSHRVEPIPIQIVERKVWDASGKPAAQLQPHTNGKITNIVIHHTETPNEAAEKAPARILSIYTWHTQGRPKPWKDIAYHYFIAPDGKIYQGRDDRFQTDTGAAYPLDGTLTVSLLGDYRETLPTEAALDSLVAFLREKIKTHSLAPTTVSTHGQRSGGITDCPGPQLQKWFNHTGKNLLTSR